MSPGTRGRRVTAVLATLIGAVCVYAIRQVDADLYGHFVYGRLFVEQGGPVDVDPFAYTSAGGRWVAFEYLAQMSIWRAYDLLGPAGLMLWKSLLGGVALWCLWRAVRTAADDALVSVPVFALAAVPLSRYFLFRPQVVTYACFSIFVAILFGRLLTRRGPLWLLPLVMLVWANSHGGFVAGLGALGLALTVLCVRNVSARPRAGESVFAGAAPLAVTTAACVVASFVTPWGTGLWRYVLTELTHDTNRQYIAEWQPLSWHADPWSVVAIAGVTLALLLAGWASAGRRIKGLWPWHWAVTCLPLLILSVVSVRHVPLAVTWAAPVLALLAAEAWRARPSRLFAAGWMAVATAALLPVVAAVQHVARNPRPAIAAGGTLLGTRDPCRVVTAMRENHVRGNVYTPLWWGSYLTWRLYPDVRVSMDGRNITVFPGSLVLENLRFYADSEGDDPTIPARHETDFLLVPTDAPVLVQVRGTPLWREVYADADAALFARADRAPAGIAALAPPREACPSQLR